VSFIKKAQEAAAQAADVARARAQEAAAVANRSASDPATAESLARGARDAVGMARELTNQSLRGKGSPYRIAEVSISASIPPAVSFAIGRLGDELEEVVGEVVASSELVELSADAGELVLALDGTTVDTAAVAFVAPRGLDSDAMPPSSLTPG
jgi:hypothetical protein